MAVYDGLKYASSAFETITDAVDRLAQAKLIRGFLLSSGSDRSQH